MPALTRLFISYRSLDSARVDMLVSRLRSLRDSDGAPRYHIWQDKTGIQVGQDWWKAIVQGINDCDIFVFMVSVQSVQNINCRAELSYARRRNRPIIPLVLENEFFFNPRTGKNDITYWDQLPVELIEGRFQFLFYEGLSFVEQLDRAVELQKSLGIRDIPASEPPDPTLAIDSNNNIARIYDQACDLAWRMDMTGAEQLFQRVVDWQDTLFSGDAYEWILLLRNYAHMLELANRDSTRYQLPALWAEYVRQFPTRFTPHYDPANLAERSQSIELAAHTAHVFEVVPAPSAVPDHPLLPAPFAWVEIPSGVVTLGWGGYIKYPRLTVDVPAFTIGRYPVTNAQFQKFIEAGGYHEVRWWSATGWHVCKRENWTHPCFWHDKKSNKPEQPVSGVSWYEAMAFCLWLSEAVGKPVKLPVEAAWQRAAQALRDGSDSGYVFPWGNEWDGKKCNNRVFPEKSDRTTAVTTYESKGNISPCGVVDMTGNVWEWCLTDYDTGTADTHTDAQFRVARGGAWLHEGTADFRVDYRGWGTATYRFSGGGFRITLASDGR